MVEIEQIIRPFAEGGDKTTVPQNSAQGFVNYTDGYTTAYEISLTANNPQAKAVERRAMNALFYSITRNIRGWQAQSIAPWIAGRVGAYEKNAMVTDVSGSQMEIYRSLTDSNTARPATTPTSWERQPLWSEMRSFTPFPMGGRSATAATESLLTQPSNFNDAKFMTNGFWVFQTDAIAQASTNVPGYVGRQVRMGQLEVMDWANTGGTRVLQRYTDVEGRIFVRFIINNVPGAWSVHAILSDIQSGSMNFGQATMPSTNNYSILVYPPLTQNTLVEGTEVRTFFAGNIINTGAATVTINGLGPFSITWGGITPLYGGELIGCATLRYLSGSMHVICGTGVQSSVYPATNDIQLPNLGQVKALVNSAKLTDVQWSQVQNKPNVAIQDYDVGFKNVVIRGASNIQPSLLFQVDKTPAQAESYKVYSPGDNALSFKAPGRASPDLTINNTGSLSIGNGYVYTVGVHVNNNAAIFFKSDNEPYHQFAIHQVGSGSKGRMGIAAYDGQTGAYKYNMMMFSTTDQRVAFDARPTFNGATPWDTNNFDANSVVYKGTSGKVNESPYTVFQNSNIPWDSSLATVGLDNYPLAVQAAPWASTAGGSNKPVAIVLANWQYMAVAIGLDPFPSLIDNRYGRVAIAYARGASTVNNSVYEIIHEGLLPAAINKMANAPTWNNQAVYGPWNVNLGSYLQKSVTQSSAATGLWSADVINMAGSYNAYPNAALSILGSPYSPGTNGSAAVMTFHRPGAYAVMLGLDQDNVMKIGGGSMGGVAYPIIHTGNLPAYIGTTYSQGIECGSVGSYALMLVYDAAQPYGTIYANNIVDGSMLNYTSSSGLYFSGKPPAGTKWRCMGYVHLKNAQFGYSTSLFMRVS